MTYRFVTALSCWLVLLALSTTLVHAEPKQATPDAHTLSGEPFYFKEHNQQWIIIHYWSDWCRSCVKEIPALNAFVKKHPKVVFRGVHLDNPSVEKQERLQEKLNIQFPLIYNVHSIYFLKPQHVKGIPATFVFRPNNSHYEAHYGPLSLKQLESIIES